MLPPLRHAEDALNLVSHHPAQQVDTVDALIHKTSTVACPFSAPGGLRVVAFAAIPAYMNGTMRELAKPPRFDCRTKLLNGNVKPVLVAGSDFYTTRFRATNDLVRIRQTHGNRFFNDAVYPTINAVERNFGVFAAAGCNGSELNRLVFQQITMTRITTDLRSLSKPVFLKKSLHGVGFHVADRDELQSRFENCFDMVACNSATADQRKFHDIFLF